MKSDKESVSENSNILLETAIKTFYENKYLEVLLSGSLTILWKISTSFTYFSGMHLTHKWRNYCIFV
jgi:hypothetical protein